MMTTPKIGKSKDNRIMHYSIGAIIENKEEYLLIDRLKPPFGFAGLAGHIDDGESEIEALVREIKEESGLNVTHHELLFEDELDWNECSKGVRVHYWYLFRCNVKGEISQNTRETKSIGWYSKKEIKKLSLEPVWDYWFRKLEII